MTRLDRRAVGMLVGTVVLVAVMLPLAAGREQAFDTVLYATLPLVLGVVGTLIASQHPGWSWSCCSPTAGPRAPLAPGHLASLAGAALQFVGQALNADTTGFSGGRNPLGVDSPLVGAARAVGMALLVAGLVAAVASSVLRYRRARGVERQQLKWFAYAGLVLTPVMALAGFPAPGLEAGRGRGDPDGGGGVPARPPPHPGRGGPALQPASLRRRPDHPGVQRTAAPAGRPGQPDGELLAVVEETVQPTHTSLWLRLGHSR